MRVNVNSLYLNLLNFLMWFTLFYPSLKYFLGYGDQYTSGVYRDGIPLWYRASDDLIVLMILLLLILISVKSRGSVKGGTPFIFLYCSFGVVFLAAVARLSIGIVPVIKELFLLFLFGLSLTFSPRSSLKIFFARDFPRFIKLALWIVLFSYVLQVVLFATIGKPPVLSWSSDFSRIFDGGIIRFGGVASSPNEASVLAIVLAILVQEEKRWMSVLKWLCVGVLLILSKSDTGYGLAIILACLRYPLIFTPAILGAFSFVAFGGNDVVLDQSSVYHLTHMAAEGSEWNFFAQQNEIIGKNETLFVFILDNIGFSFALLLFSSFVVGVVAAFQGLRKNTEIRGLSEVIILISVSCLVIPTIFYYPIGFIFLLSQYKLFTEHAAVA